MSMNYPDIVRAATASFAGRFETQQFLAELTDAVVSHRREKPLNYLYFEVCRQG